MRLRHYDSFSYEYSSSSTRCFASLQQQSCCVEFRAACCTRYRCSVDRRVLTKVQADLPASDIVPWHSRCTPSPNSTLPTNKFASRVLRARPARDRGQGILHLPSLYFATTVCMVLIITLCNTLHQVRHTKYSYSAVFRSGLGPSLRARGVSHQQQTYRRKVRQRRVNKEANQVISPSSTLHS